MRELSFMILLVVLAYSFAYPQSDSVNKDIFFRADGSGIQNTASFKTTKPWVLIWLKNEDDGMVFSVYLMTMDDKLADILVSSNESVGRTYSNKIGKFYLKVGGTCNWDIHTVYQDIWLGNKKRK